MSDDVNVTCFGDADVVDPGAAAARAAALAECARLRAMTPAERVVEAGKRDRPYADSLMQCTFPSLRAIRHVNGVILLVADDVSATRQALAAVTDALGPDASAKEVLDKVDKTRVRTTLMSVSMFKRNLANVLALVNGNAQYFGAGTGGGQLKDIYQEGLAAIKEAEAYWRKENKILTEQLRSLMMSGSATDEASFDTILGKDWKKSLDPDTRKLLGA